MYRSHVLLLPCFWSCALIQAVMAVGVPAQRRPNSNLWHDDEPLVARIAGIIVALLASSACAAFFCLSTPPRLWHNWTEYRATWVLTTVAVFRLVQVRSWRLLPPHGWCKYPANVNPLQKAKRKSC